MCQISSAPGQDSAVSPIDAEGMVGREKNLIFLLPGSRLPVSLSIAIRGGDKSRKGSDTTSGNHTLYINIFRPVSLSPSSPRLICFCRGFVALDADLHS